MKVQDIFTRQAKTCGCQSTLASVGWMMWEQDCGVLPVVDEQGKVIGMVTDRDICMGAVTKGRTAAEISVGEVIDGEVFSCRPDDDVKTALETMMAHQVRRLPVVGQDGKIQGILSLNDVALAAKLQWDAKASDITYDDLARISHN